MKKQIIFAVLLLMGIDLPIPAFAEEYTSPDWEKVTAQLKTLPPDFLRGVVPPTVVDEVIQKLTSPKGVPKSWTIINGGNIPDIMSGKRDDHGLIRFTNSDGYPDDQHVNDPLGLLVISRDSGDGYPQVMSAISISNPVAVSGPASSEIKYEMIQQRPTSGVGTWLYVMDVDCQLNGQPDTLIRACKTSTHYISGHVDIVGNSSVSTQRGYDRATIVSYKGEDVFDEKLGFFYPGRLWDGAVDWKMDDTQWHSIAVSAALSPQQKDQVRQIFARGFDLYKSGDLTGARALVEAGLKTDPSNYLAWFTMGEIGRSTATQNPDRFSDGQMWGKAAEQTYYQHTIDLAPDSPEAALAKGYLAALH